MGFQGRDKKRRGGRRDKQKTRGEKKRLTRTMTCRAGLEEDGVESAGADADANADACAAAGATVAELCCDSALSTTTWIFPSPAITGSWGKLAAGAAAAAECTPFCLLSEVVMRCLKIRISVSSRQDPDRCAPSRIGSRRWGRDGSMAWTWFHFCTALQRCCVGVAVLAVSHLACRRWPILVAAKALVVPARGVAGCKRLYVSCKDSIGIPQSLRM